MDLEVKLKELEMMVSGLEMAQKEKDGMIADLTAQVAILMEQNKQLDKSLAIEKERALKAEAMAMQEREQKVAATIMDTLLANSSLPERLHGKLKNYFDYRTFKGEAEFTKDSEAAQRFADAFKSEIVDFEASIGQSPNVGISVAKSPIADNNTIDDDVEYGRSVARRFAGRIRSDEV